MRCALIILDMINSFDFEGGERLAAQAMKMFRNIATLRETFAAHNWPVLYVNDNFTD